MEVRSTFNCIHDAPSSAAITFVESQVKQSRSVHPEVLWQFMCTHFPYTLEYWFALAAVPKQATHSASVNPVFALQS